MRAPARLGACLFLLGLLADLLPAAADRPNILWLTSEDHGPHMGCYGDTYASTPNMDALAARGMIYDFAWSNAPVCAPARTAIISGLFPPATGGEHMRSMVPFPKDKSMYPQFLRKAGYYCTNNSKEDYNISKPGKVWDESSKTAHWKNRARSQPFFAIFNSTRSHESQLRIRPHEFRHDPAGVRVPAYHPDTPEVRLDWAQYYDTVSDADEDAGRRLAELEAAGLAEETIVFYYGDHGSGMPRNKRWPYNSGLHVPMIVYIPEKYADLRPPEYRAGGRSERLISFIDLAPTVLSLAGIAPPEWMHGSAFLGRFQAPPARYVHGFRGRMDERYDLVRSVSDGRYVYIRNYMPHRIYGQYIEYMFRTPTTRIWKELFDAGKLNEAQARFWQRKPPEELYDLKTDPDEVVNLARNPEYIDIRNRLRAEQQAQAARIRDVGFLPEGEMFTRKTGVSPYDWAHDDTVYPFDRVFATAELASMLEPEAVPRLIDALSDTDSAVRYWGAMGLLMRGEGAVSTAANELRRALHDESPFVRIVAAETLGTFGHEEDLAASLKVLGELSDTGTNNALVALAALGSIDALDQKAAPLWPQVARYGESELAPDPRYGSYPSRIIEAIQARLQHP